MRVILRITTGPSEGRQIPVRSGEVARFGRGGFADISFPDDHEMSDIHFELECLPTGCLLRNLSESGETRLNGQSVSETVFRNGDTISAGKTDFHAVIEGEVADEGPAVTGDGPADDVPDAETAPQTAAEICERLDLEDESRQLLLPEHSPAEFLDVLISQAQHADAIRVLAYLLPKRQAVWWAYSCVHKLTGKDSSPNIAAVLDAAHVWVQDPSEQHRREAMSAVETAGFESPASWVALAAFWSGGSIAPVESPEVPPDDCLTSQGVSAALVMSATQGDPSQSSEIYQSFLNLGKEIFNGDQELPEA